MPDFSRGMLCTYMPHVVVEPPDVRIVAKDSRGYGTDDYLGVRFVAGPIEVRPNQQVSCSLKLMYFPHVNYDSLQVGATFTIREGGKVVGFGVVTKRIEACE